jgi:hypothetical protein
VSVGYEESIILLSLAFTSIEKIMIEGGVVVERREKAAIIDGGFIRDAVPSSNAHGTLVVGRGQSACL